MDFIRTLGRFLSGAKQYRLFDVNKFKENYEKHVSPRKNEDNVNFYFVQTFSYREDVELEPIDSNFRLMHPSFKIKKEHIQNELHLAIKVGYRNLIGILSYSILIIIAIIYVLYDGILKTLKPGMLPLASILLIPILMNYIYFLYKRKQMTNDFILFILQDIDFEEI